MLQRRVVKFDTKERFNVSFFEDDMIETVRQQIGIALDTHPNRLLVLVGVKLPANYYTTDPRRWEALFDRMSYNGQPIKKEQFQEYLKEYRSPSLSIPFHSYDRNDWLAVPESLSKLFMPSEDFVEYRILGVEESRSYILPMIVKDQFSSKIPSTLLPIAELKNLLYTFYDSKDITDFIVRPFSETDETVARAYYPFLQPNTPPRLTEDTVNLLAKNGRLLDDLLHLKVVEEESVSIKRSRYIVTFVTTDLGSAIRTRFEQIFYGLTVSPEIPYIQFFTSKNETNRHKFYTEDTKHKTPVIDTADLKSWLNSTRPQRNRPTLLLYRGTSKENFDRISITSNDIILTTYRDRKNKQTLSELKKDLYDWLLTFDSVMGFIDPSDVQLDRWVLDDMAISIKYKKSITDNLDLRRFNCVSSIFNLLDSSKDTFRLLRTDHTADGISAVEIKILQMKSQQGFVGIQDIQTELNVSTEQATQLLRQVETKLEENPSLGSRAFRGYPALHIDPDFILFSSISNLDLAIKYANILRFVLTNPKSDELDKICPKRMETVEVKSLIEPTFDSTTSSEYADLFADLEEEIVEDKTETQSVKTETVSLQKKQDTLYSYFNNRLRSFDPQTFNSTSYPKKCEQKHQPIILTDEDIEQIKDTPYDPTTYLDNTQLLQLDKPKGSVICPEYWCMKDNIPLQETQLLNENGVLKCPKCKGRVRDSNDNDIREFTLIKREKSFAFPGITKTGKFPCCFKKAQTKKLTPDAKEDDKYYVLGETKPALGEYRFAFLPISLIKSLHIEENYDLIVRSGRRIPSGLSGYFRVGIGHATNTLPQLLTPKTLNFKIKSPIESIDIILKCSFLATWKRVSDKHVEQILSLLMNISPFEKDDVLRKNISRIISGIQEAYENKELSPIQELEYATLSMQCDVFRIYTDTNTMGCMFSSFINRPKNRAIIILQNEENIDILSMIQVVNRNFVYRSNIYELPFNKNTRGEVERLRNLSCRTEVPSYNDALSAMPDILASVHADSYSVILDPFGRGQAFYVESKLILPFKPTPLPDIAQPKIIGYKDVHNLPTYDDVKGYLTLAQGYSTGYSWREDVFDNDNRKVEIITQSGLPIPIQPVAGEGENTEVSDTVRTYGETELVYGDPSQELESVYRDVNYSSEVFEFLLFQLSRDLADDDYLQLRDALEFSHKKNLNTLLEKWFSKTTMFIDIENSSEFISKVRQPCGQFTKNSCKGNLCGWDGKVCKMKIKSTVDKDDLFNRLMKVITTNLKIRAAVLDNRITPFFSTILYLELPHEIIMTDGELNLVNV
jgi:hypothetical protein